jgi:hypothetical protein
LCTAGKGKDKTVRKRVSFDNSDMETSIFDPPSTAKEPLTDEQQLELGKHARRQAIFALLTAKHAGLTQAFVSAVITLLCLPDANGCKFALQMAQKLLDLSLLDARFIVPVAKDAFSAVLSVLLGQVSPIKVHGGKFHNNANGTTFLSCLGFLPTTHCLMCYWLFLCVYHFIRRNGRSAWSGN